MVAHAILDHTCILESFAMGLSIKNDSVEDMIRTLAARRGVSMTEAVRQAVAEELAREDAARAAEKAEWVARIMAIVAEAKTLPRLNDLTDDEILGYDEFGLPH